MTSFHARLSKAKKTMVENAENKVADETSELPAQAE
jgi:hypothetical protein